MKMAPALALLPAACLLAVLAAADAASEASPQVEAQIERLRSSDPVTRATAASTLFMLREDAAPAAPALVRLLADETRVQFSTTQEGPGWYRNIIYKFYATGGRTTVGEQAVRTLIGIGPPAVPLLLEAVKNPAVSARASWAIQHIAWFPQMGDTRVLEALLAALDDSSVAVRVAACQALGLLRDERAVEPLERLRGAPDKQVQDAAAEAIRRITAKDNRESLIAQLDGLDPSVSRAAAYRLAAMRDSRAVDVLLSSLNDSEKSVRRSAVRALGQTGDPRVIETLAHLLHDKDKYVRLGALWSLAQFRDPRVVAAAPAFLKEKEQDYRKGIVDALAAARDPAAVPLLLGLARDKDLYVRQTALAALGYIGGDQAVATLLEAVSDSNVGIRQSVAGALGDAGDLRGVEPLLALLSNPESQVRTAAAGALWRLGDARAAPALVSAVERHEAERRTERARLGVHGSDSMDLLLALVRDPDRDIRRNAIWTLGHADDPRAGELLVALAQRPSEFRPDAFSALAERGDPRVFDLGQALPEEVREENRALVIGILSKLNDVRVINRMRKALDDPDPFVRINAAWALARVTATQCGPDLMNREKCAALQ